MTRDHHLAFPQCLRESSKRGPGLAPMEGVTDLPLRLWFSLASRPDWAITPFFRVTQDFPLRKLPHSFCPDLQLGKESGLPHTIPQLMGSDPKELARIGNSLLQSHEVIDFNFGCPAPTVVGNMAGSALIRECGVLKSFLRALFHDFPAERASIKTRLGYSHPEEVFALAEIFSNYPLYQLTLHGRTREQRYQGSADWEKISKAAQLVPFPIVASGDIVTCVAYRKATEKYPSIQKHLIGRGALRNPWIFEEIRRNQSVSLSSQTLQTSLECLLLIVESHQAHPAAFLDFLSAQRFGNFAGSSAESWLQLKSLLHGHLGQLRGHFDGLDEVRKTSFSRLKMVWNGIRTSLAPSFFDPQFLRSRSPSEFFAHFQFLCDKEVADTTTHVLKHYPNYDWLYSGESRKKSTTPTTKVVGLRRSSS